MPPNDSVAAAIARLDAESRAVLELSGRRHLGDKEIAGLLGVEPSQIAQRRRLAEARLGFELGVPDEAHDQLREQLSLLDEQDWRNGRPVGNGHAPGDGRPLAARRIPGRVLAVGALLLAAGALVALVIALSGGDEPDRSTRGRPAAAPGRAGSRPAPSAPKAGAPAGPVRSMQRLNGTYGHGTAQLLRTGNGARLRLRISGFLRPRGGGYAVWLFNSRDDARRLTATTDTAIESDLLLPRGFRRYGFVDVARAVPALDSAHSGLSLLRVPLSELTR